jgi:hypothetical protein
VLPPRFTKIRHYGLLGNNRRHQRVPLARAALATSPLRFAPSPTQRPAPPAPPPLAHPHTRAHFHPGRRFPPGRWHPLRLLLL